MIGSDFFHYLKVLANIDKPITQTSELERTLIRKYATGVAIAVEIGVFEAVNSVEIASVLSDSGTLYGIDPFFTGKMGISYQKRISLHHIQKSKVSNKIKLIEKLSFDAGKDIPDGIDFIFIDGDHSWDGIEKDWNIWFPKMKSGGIIALHDTNFPEYTSAYSSLDSIKFFHEVLLDLKSIELIDKVDRLSVVRKK